jgi:signal transduction histidine kinase
MRCRLDLPDQLPHAALTSQVRHNLYLCVKEALNNIVKHSGSDEVTIAMRVMANSFTITISDNGHAGAVNGHGRANGNGTHHDVRVAPGQGLANIAQRVAEMDGTCEFTPPAAGQGARLAITIPLNARSPTSRLPAVLFRKPTP